MVGTLEQPRRDDWTAPLRTRFPMLTSTVFGCRQGWRSIVSRMLERIEAAVVEQPAAYRRGLKVNGIREKFGVLSVYLSKEATPEIQAVIDEASTAAMVTCEVCGTPGRLAERRGWISVKCDPHENWSRFDEAV